MASVFISYDSRDYYVVSLLEELLRFHYINVWCAPSDIRPGANFSSDIEQALKRANVLIVVSSVNALSSKWVPKEITTFQTRHQKASIIPILLDSTNVDEITPGLSSFQAIDFSKSMLGGCRTLFRSLGKDFMSNRDRRNDFRRDSKDRRRGYDRRSSTTLQRMRQGFWLAYAKHTGKGEFDEINDSLREKFKVIDALREVAEAYKYFKGPDLECDSTEVLQKTTQTVWTLMKERGHFKAVYIVEGIAEEIHDQYDIQMQTRRHSPRRESTDRREHR